MRRGCADEMARDVAYVIGSLTICRPAPHINKGATVRLHYKPHGTTALYAALTGEIAADKLTKRRRPREYLQLLKQVERKVPKVQTSTSYSTISAHTRVDDLKATIRHYIDKRT